MANPVPYGSKLHIPPINYHLLAAQQEPYKKSLTLNKKYLSFLEKKSGEWTIRKKLQDRKSKRTRQEKNKRGDRKGKSNDSPAIPDRSGPSDIPSLPSGYKDKNLSKFGND